MRRVYPENETKKCSNFNEDYQLVTNSQDIESIVDMLGISNDTVTFYTTLRSIGDIGSMFLKQYEGEVSEIWIHPQDIPMIKYYYERLY